MEDNKYYISRQIAVYKTTKTLCEFLNKLNTAPIEKYAHLHAKGDEILGNTWRVYSNIGIVIQDYSKGIGENIIRVTANISPENIEYIFLKLTQGIQDFKFEESKVFGEADENGLSTVTKLSIIRMKEYKDRDGKLVLRNYPWQFYIENGRGRKEKTPTGGTKYVNYKCLKKAQVAFNDHDLFCILKQVVRFIDIWEIANCTKLLKTAMIEIKKLKEEHQGAVNT